MDIQVGDTLTMKKPHPCGSHDWQVLRIGADFKLRCVGCGHEVMGPRSKFEKNVVRSLEYCFAPKVLATTTDTP